MCGSMADIQSAAAEIRRGKKRKKKKKKKNKPQHENIMVYPITWGDHKQSSHKVSGVSPKAERESMVGKICERGIGLLPGVKERGS